MKAIRAFLDACGTPEKIELLPYHAMGEHKYTALDMASHTFCVPDESKIAKFKEILDI